MKDLTEACRGVLEEFNSPQVSYLLGHSLSVDQIFFFVCFSPNFYKYIFLCQALEEAIKKRTFSPVGVHFLKKLLNEEELDSKAALILYMDATGRQIFF